MSDQRLVDGVRVSVGTRVVFVGKNDANRKFVDRSYWGLRATVTEVRSTYLMVKIDREDTEKARKQGVRYPKECISVYGKSLHLMITNPYVKFCRESIS